MRRCLAGEPAAWREFQETYGPLIYGYPTRTYRLPPDAAADYYTYAFDDGRIFGRLRTYEGRAPLRAYLLSYVLDALLIDWRRAQRRLPTVSIEDLEGFEMTDDGRGQEHEPDPELLNRLLEGLDPAKSVVMKLLHIEDAELTAEEVQYVARVSGQSVLDVLGALERLRASVREREAEQKELDDTLDAVHAWIQLYEHRLHELRSAAAGLAAAAGRAPEEECAEIERKLGRRQSQRAKLVAQLKGHRVTVTYKDIAALLKTSTGNVGSQISRLRQELQKRGIADLLEGRE